MDSWIDTAIALPLHNSIVNIVTIKGIKYNHVKFHQENSNWKGYFDDFEFNIFVLLDNVVKWSHQKK